MKSRRVHRAHGTRRQLAASLETYRLSSRGLARVFESLVPEEDSAGREKAARAAHHLAQVEAMLPHVREAIRSCRYPGAEQGDGGELVWGLWGHLSEAGLHLHGAVKALESLGRRYSHGNGSAPGGRRRTARKAGKRRAR